MNNDLERVLIKFNKIKSIAFENGDEVKSRFNELYFKHIHNKFPSKYDLEFINHFKKGYEQTFSRYLRLYFRLDLNKDIKDIIIEHDLINNYLDAIKYEK